MLLETISGAHVTGPKVYGDHLQQYCDACGRSAKLTSLRAEWTERVHWSGWGTVILCAGCSRRAADDWDRMKAIIEGRCEDMRAMPTELVDAELERGRASLAFRPEVLRRYVEAVPSRQMLHDRIVIADHPEPFADRVDRWKQVLRARHGVSAGLS